MQIESLKIFCDVVRLKSFSEAAAKNRVSQSTASQTVNQLEEHLGTTLIDRSHRPWKLTPEGKLFYEGCREVVTHYDDLEAEVKSLHEKVSSVVRVACIYSVGLRHMNRHIEEFTSLNPGVRVELECRHPDEVYEGVLNEEVDLGIVSFPQSRRDLTIIPWRTEPMVLACYPDHPFTRRKEINPATLSGKKFVAFNKKLVIRREIDRFLKKHAADPEVVLEFDNIEAIKNAVEVGSGISLLPRPTLDREVRTGTLVAIPLSVNGLVRPLGILHRRGRKLNRQILRFIELLQNEGKTKEGGLFHEAKRIAS